MVEDIKEQLSSSWRRAGKLLKPMIDLSRPYGPYACSEPKTTACLNWRPYRDEVGETRVTSFRTAITSFWSRILGILDEEDWELADVDTNRSSVKFVPVDIFTKMFIEKIQPFVTKNWKLSMASSDDKITKIVFATLRTRYSEAIEILRKSSGCKSSLDALWETWTWMILKDWMRLGNWKMNICLTLLSWRKKSCTRFHLTLIMDFVLRVFESETGLE